MAFPPEFQPCTKEFDPTIERIAIHRRHQTMAFKHGPRRASCIQAHVASSQLVLPRRCIGRCDACHVVSESTVHLHNTTQHVVRAGRGVVSRPITGQDRLRTRSYPGHVAPASVHVSRRRCIAYLNGRTVRHVERTKPRGRGDASWNLTIGRKHSGIDSWNCNRRPPRRGGRRTACTSPPTRRSRSRWKAAKTMVEQLQGQRDGGSGWSE